MDNNLEEMFSMYLGINTNEEIMNNKFTNFIIKQNKIDLNNFADKIYLTTIIHNLCIQYLFSDIYYIILKNNLKTLYNKNFTDEDINKFIKSFKKLSFIISSKELNLNIVPISEKNKIYRNMNLIKHLEELSIMNSKYLLNNPNLYEELKNNNILIFDKCQTAGCIKCAKIREQLNNIGINEYLELQNKTIYDRINKFRDYETKEKRKLLTKEN